MRERTDFLGRDGYTWWVGEVEDISDPSQLGRVRVRILGWYTGHKTKQDYIKEVPTKVLPWATVLLPNDQPGTKSSGTRTELQPGAWVLGFFLDGDEANMPVVLGNFRGFQMEDPEQKTTIADSKDAKARQTDSRLKKTVTGQEANDGHPMPAVQSVTPTNEKGGTEEARGPMSTLTQYLPGNAVTNPQKPPVEKQAIADGVVGPAGEGFETDLTRMLTELGNMAAMLGSGPTGWASLATGSRIAGDKVREHLGKIINFLSSGISVILAPLKELLAKAIAEVINALVKIISAIIPIGVLLTIIGLLDKIFELFCAPKPMWLGLVQAAISDTVNFANQMAQLAINKVADLINAAIGSAVEGVTNRILSAISNVMNRMSGIVNDILSAVNTAKAMVEAAMSVARSLDMIFKFDFTKLDWGSLLGLILGILGLFIKKDCKRKIKRPKARAWWPVIGTTECTDIDAAIKGTPYGSLPAALSNAGAGAAVGGFQGGGSWVDKLFQNIDPYLQQTQTFLNGSSKLFDATPGKEKTIETGPGGVSNFQDSFGNEHTNVPNNQTKIIGRDKCETIKGNYVLTVEGDFYLKVMGNYHEEITGAYNAHNSQGPQSESEGSSKKPDIAATKVRENASAKVDTNVTADQPKATDDDNKVNLSVIDQRRYKILKMRNDGGFYPVDRIPFEPGADEFGRTPWGPQLSGTLKDDKEQKSASRKEGDHEIAYTGDVTIQGARVKLQGMNSLNINSQTVKIEANSIENVADGEIINEANWITSFLNAGRMEFIAAWNPFAAFTGSLRWTRGSVFEFVTDIPFPALAPPTLVRCTVTVTQPGTIHDLCAGSVSGVINSFIACPTGVITEFVPSGSIVSQVVAGMMHNGVGSGFMSTGCAFGPHQVYGLPLLLN